MRRVLRKTTAPIFRVVPDRPGLRPRQFRPDQGQRPQPFQQHIRKTRQQQPELVGPPVVATGPVGKQTQLLFLDPVLHLASRTILVVKLLRGSGEVGDQEAGYLHLGRMFGFHNDAPFLVPSGCRILDFAKVPLLFLAGVEGVFRRPHQWFGSGQQPGVLRQPHEVMHVCDVRTSAASASGKSPSHPENDFHLRPRLPQSLNQQFQNRPRVRRRATIPGPQIRHQQLFAAENIERQKTIVAVVAVKVCALLPAMHAIIRRVQVEDQLGGWRAERSGELIHENPVQRPGGGAIRAVFQTAERGAGSQRFDLFDGRLPDRSSRKVS